MTEAAIATPEVDTSELSAEETIALATKMSAEAPKPALVDPSTGAPTETAPADAAPPVDEAAPVEAPVVDPKATERAERLARVLANAGEWKQKQALRDAQAKHEAVVASAKAEAEAARAEAAALKERLAAYKDPARALEAFERDGVPADLIAQGAVRAGTPEYKAEQELRSLREEIAAIKSANEASAKAQAEERAKHEESQKAALYDRARQDFVKQASDVSAYPALAKLANLRPMALVQHAEEILQHASARTGQSYTNAEVLTYLNSLYSDGAADQKSGQPASVTTSQGTASGTGAPGTNAASKPRTLTNSMTEKTAVASKPVDEMSNEEFKKWASTQGIVREASRG